MNHIQWIPPARVLTSIPWMKKKQIKEKRSGIFFSEVSNEVYVIILVLCDCGLLLICNIVK